MRKKMVRLIQFFFLFFLAAILFIFFLPRSYDTPVLQKRANTQYWNLPSGSRIAYTLVAATGIKKTYPVIFLQGGPGGPIYDRNIQMLSPLSEEGHDIFLYDQVGCGFSSRLENINDYTVERHKRDLEEIIKIIGKEKVILIGQSWGAILATSFIADNPEKVDKVIFTGPAPIYPLNKKLANMEAPDSLHLIKPITNNADAIKKSINTRTRLTAFLARTYGVKLASDKEMDGFQTYQDGLNKSTVCDTSKAPKTEAGSGFYSQIMTLKSLNEINDPRPKLKDLKIPVLIMKGQCDTQKWGYLTEYFEFFPEHQFTIIPNAGHSISIEQPELYLKTIRLFLNK